MHISMLPKNWNQNIYSLAFGRDRKEAFYFGASGTGY
jgi:hypothetical protein